MSMDSQWKKKYQLQRDAASHGGRYDPCHCVGLKQSAGNSVCLITLTKCATSQQILPLAVIDIDAISIIGSRNWTYTRFHICLNCLKNTFLPDFCFQDLYQEIFFW